MLLYFQYASQALIPRNISSAHLETAKTPPFIDPKQERATNTGTAKEKFPISRSAKVCWKRERNTQYFFIKWEDNCPLLTNYHGVSYTPSLEIVLCICCLFCESTATTAELSYPCPRGHVEDLHSSSDEEVESGPDSCQFRPWWLQRRRPSLNGSKSDLHTSYLFFLRPSLYSAGATQCYSPSIPALVF